jgi:nucleoside-diphosphate-sugar epimerase
MKISNKKILIAGGGGFIGGYIAKKLLEYGNTLIVADIKPKKKWFQIFSNAKNYVCDLKDYDSTLKLTKNIDYVFNMACNMGGMGFIENNKAECMISVLINTNLLRASVKNKVKKFFFSSSACAYNTLKQNKSFIKGLKEDDAYPAYPEDGYGWEKLFSERMCRHFKEDFGLETRVARYHNVYGPLGTFEGGREKAPAALCRKVADKVINNKKFVEIWGDGKQTRSFTFIEDAIKGVELLMGSEIREPLNIGSSEIVDIDTLVEMVEVIAGISPKLVRKYDLNAPKGVRGRNSDNNKIRSLFNWEPKISLNAGLEKTYDWIYNEIQESIKVKPIS